MDLILLCRRQTSKLLLCVLRLGEEDEAHQGRDRAKVQDVGERGGDSPWRGPAGGLHHLGAAQGQAAAADQPGWATRQTRFTCALYFSPPA